MTTLSVNMKGVRNANFKDKSLKWSKNMTAGISFEGFYRPFYRFQAPKVF